MKTLLILLFSSSLYSQDCLNDVQRRKVFERMEVYNHYDHRYEKYRKSTLIHPSMIVNTEKRTILFMDSTSLYKSYNINECEAPHRDSTIYYCTDVPNRKHCTIVITPSDVTVIYEPEPVIFRLK